MKFASTEHAAKEPTSVQNTEQTSQIHSGPHSRAAMLWTIFSISFCNFCAEEPWSLPLSERRAFLCTNPFWCTYAGSRIQRFWFRDLLGCLVPQPAPLSCGHEHLGWCNKLAGGSQSSSLVENTFSFSFWMNGFCVLVQLLGPVLAFCSSTIRIRDSGWAHSSCYTREHPLSLLVTKVTVLHTILVGSHSLWMQAYHQMQARAMRVSHWSPQHIWHRFRYIPDLGINWLELFQQILASNVWLM